MMEKILALAAPSRTAARDLFDLHHLFFQSSIASSELRKVVDRHDLEEALTKVERFTYNDFREQVLPYLTDELRELYRSASDFKSLREKVEERFLETLS